MEDYDIIRHLGSGSYGEAFLATKKDDATKCVLKEIKIGHLNKNELIDANQEVQVLASLVHNHITRFHNTFCKDASLFIVMEYCAGGDLKSLIYNRKNIHFPEERILDWFCQLCLAIKYIHDRHIIHRDIKPQNVLLTEDGKVKLGDFGIAKTLDKTSDLANTCIGTPYYLSPEMCENKPYSMKSDIWSLGCVLYELTALRHAFDAKNMKILVTKIVKCSYQSIPNQYSRDMKLLIAAIFQRDYKSRPSINIILKKSFILKRISRFVSEDDCMQLKASISSTKGKKLSLNPAKRSAIGRRIGISAPLAKYGNSSKGLSPKVRYGSVKRTSISNINTPKACNYGSYQKSVNQRSKYPKRDVKSPHSLSSKDDLFPVHYARKQVAYNYLKGNRRKPSPKVNLTRNANCRSINENNIGKAKPRTSICDKSFLNCAETKLTISQCLINTIHDPALYDSKVSICEPKLGCIAGGNKYSTPIQKNIRDRRATPGQSSRSSLLRKKITALASSEVKKVTKAAQELRRNRSSYHDMGIHCNNGIVHGLLSPEDINISVPSVSRTTRQRDSFEDILRLNEFVDPSVASNEDSKNSLSFCRPKWNPAATPIFSSYPLELTDTLIDSTYSTDGVEVFLKRRQWSNSNNEILQILSSASLSDGQINTSGKMNELINDDSRHKRTSNPKWNHLSKSKSLPSAMNEQLILPCGSLAHSKNTSNVEQKYNKTIQMHELSCEPNAHSYAISKPDHIDGNRIHYEHSLPLRIDQSFNSNVRIMESFVDNSPNFDQKSKPQKTVSFDNKLSSDKGSDKPKKRLFSFLYRKTPPKNISQCDTETTDKFFKKSRLSGLLKRFTKKVDKNVSNDQFAAKNDLSFSQCLQEGELFSPKMNVSNDGTPIIGARTIPNIEALNNSNVDSGIDVASKQMNFKEFVVDPMSPEISSRYCVSLSNIDRGSNEDTYSTIEKELSAINDKDKLRKTAFVFVEGVFQSAIKNLKKKQSLNAERNLWNSDAIKESKWNTHSNQEELKLNLGILKKKANAFNPILDVNHDNNIYYADNDGFINDTVVDESKSFFDQNTFKFVDRSKSADISLSYEDLSVSNLYCHELTDFQCDNDSQHMEMCNTYVIDTKSLTPFPSIDSQDKTELIDTSLVDSSQCSFRPDNTDSKYFWKSLEDLLSMHENGNTTLPTQLNVVELGLTPRIEDVYGWIEEKKALLEEQLGTEQFVQNYKTMEKAFEAETEVMGETVIEVKSKLGLNKEHFVNHILELLVAESVYQN